VLHLYVMYFPNRLNAANFLTDMQKDFKITLLLRQVQIYVKLQNTQGPLEVCGKQQVTFPKRLFKVKM
jgi:hypothetical protein